MATKKTITLRAFAIKVNKLSQSSNSLRELLIQKLENSTTGDRRMRLNQAEAEENLLAHFSLYPNYVFGMMLRITNEGVSGQIDPKLFEQKNICIEDIASEVDSNMSLYKDHYYFLLSDDKIVVSLPTERTTKDLQTYLNWLLEDERDNCMFELQPMISQSIPTTQLREIKNVLIGSSTQTSLNTPSGTKILSLKNITKDLLKYIIQDMNTVEEIMESNLVRTELRIHFPKKVKNTSKEDFERILGATIAPISDLEGIRIETNKGTFISGEELPCKKKVEINRTSKGYVVEQELKQEMELFISKL